MRRLLDVIASKLSINTSVPFNSKDPDGSIEAVDKDQAREHLDALKPTARALYEKIENQVEILLEVTSEIDLVNAAGSRETQANR